MPSLPDEIISKLNIRDALEDELKSIVQDSSANIGYRFKDRLWRDLSKAGLTLADKSLDQLSSQLEDRLRKSEELLIQNANNNMRAKYEKFLNGIEKYVSLKLKLLVNQLLKADQEDQYTSTLANLDFPQTIPSLTQDKVSSSHIESYGMPPRPTANRMGLDGSPNASSRDKNSTKRVSVPRYASGSPSASRRSSLSKKESNTSRDEYQFDDVSENKPSVLSTTLPSALILPPSKGKKAKNYSLGSETISEKEFMEMFAKLSEVLKEHNYKAMEEIIEQKIEMSQKKIIDQISKIISDKVQEIKDQVDQKYLDCLKLQDMFLSHQLSDQNYPPRGAKSNSKKDNDANKNRAKSQHKNEKIARRRSEGPIYYEGFSKNGFAADSQAPYSGTIRKNFENNLQMLSEIKANNFGSESAVSVLPTKWCLQDSTNNSNLQDNTTNFGTKSLLQMLSPPKDVQETKFIQRKTAQGFSYYVPADMNLEKVKTHSRNTSITKCSNLESDYVDERQSLGNSEMRLESRRNSTRKTVRNEEKENCKPATVRECFEGVSKKINSIKEYAESTTAMSFRENESRRSSRNNIAFQENIPPNNLIPPTVHNLKAKFSAY